MNKLFIWVSLLIVTAGFMLGGCSFNEQVQGAQETVQEAKENASEPIPAIIGGLVATTTGIPVAAPVISFLVGLGMAIFERKRRKKTEVVAGVMAKAIEGSADKPALAEKVKSNAGAAGVGAEAHAIVRNST